MAMKRRPNNSGTVIKMSGNRANPYWARLPAKEVWDKTTCKMKLIRESLGMYRTESEAWKALNKYQDLHPEAFERVVKTLNTVSTTVTVADLYNQWTSSRAFLDKSATTQGNYTAVWNKHLVPLHDVPITAIKANTLSVLINNIDARSGTKKNALTVMRKIFDIAISNDIIDKNYADFVDYENNETEIVRNCFTPEEISKLATSQSWLADLLLIELYSGARIKEIVNLKADDVFIDAPAPYFHIREGKNKFAVRDVPIHSALYGVFNRLLSKSTDYLLKFENGANIEPRRVQDHAEDIETLVGVPHYIYDAKHTFITQCAVCGVDKLCKINIIGHTPSGTSEKVYTHIPIETLKEEIEKVKY